MMNKLRLIASNTLRETIRQRLFLNIVVFGIMLIGFAQVIANLTFGRPDRVVRSIGLSGMTLALDLLVILVGVSIIHREIEGRTALVVLTRPVRRGELVLGRYLGLALATVLAGLGFALAFSLTLASVGGRLSSPELLALFGAVLEALTVGSFAVLMSCLTTPTLGAGLSIGFLISALSIDDVLRLTRATEGAAQPIAEVLAYVLPNLERINFRWAAVYQEVLPTTTVLSASAYAFCYVVLFLAAATIALSRRELL